MKISKKTAAKRAAAIYQKYTRKKKLRRVSSSSSSSGSSSTSSSSSSSSDSCTSSSSSTTSSSSSCSSSSDDKRRKHAVKLIKNKSLKKAKILRTTKVKGKEDVSTDVPLHLMEKSKSMAPMTKEQWEKEQNVVRRVYDESSGRHRLIKGGGEVIEEIVSKERHKNINKMATKGDGEYFQKNLSTKH